VAPANGRRLKANALTLTVPRITREVHREHGPGDHEKEHKKLPSGIDAGHQEAFMSTAQRLRRQTARRQAHTPTTRPPNAPATRT
jgi:hypothetical protein